METELVLEGASGGAAGVVSTDTSCIAHRHKMVTGLETNDDINKSHAPGSNTASIRKTTGSSPMSGKYSSKM
eukprot:CAMPEP_0169155204 /NCGR_PEP_ID=MMETSP1015-20121227/53202_1 /TAXON_ID=342587 /ORGANISM="Karlodinium micrum, Strain CCMP2283" /LENGTH=71 /DNA_ID=CAMNT_0009225609 /DNA_START=91 /DNA_END=306 /DNA_ORIENTATION=+